MFDLGGLAFGIVIGWLSALIFCTSRWLTAAGVGAMALIGALTLVVPQAMYSAAAGAAIGLAAHAALRTGLRRCADVRAANGQGKGENHA